MSKILEAAYFAAKKHTNQRRKNVEDTPYINHPVEVAFLLASVGGITDEDILSAALLHDTIEDTDTHPGEIESQFGPVVLKYVQEVTDDKSLPSYERKKMQEKHAGTLSDGATLIKLADRISNLRSVTSEPPRWWTAQRQIDYFEWSHRVFINLRKLNTPLELLFQKEYNEGLLIVLQRRDHEHSMTSKIAGVRRKIRAKLLRLTRYGPP
jgi:guanosine-3',5'-bis(diphosphate) 3'-pyrophosphohydrolase